MLGSIIGGVTGLAGSLLGAGSSSKEASKNRKEASRQFNIQYDYNKNMTQYRVSDALKAGINPLAALGMSGSYSPTASSGGTSGAGEHIANGFNSLGKGISSLFQKKVSEESALLSLENQKLQNDYIRAQINNMSQPGVPVIGQGKPEAGDLYLPWRDRDGNIVWLLNPDAIADADLTNTEANRALGSGLGNWINSIRKGDSVYGRFYKFVKKHNIENPLYWKNWW